MSEQLYDIFFRGEALEGFNIDSVKQNVGQLFKAPPEKTEQLFSGKVVALKKDLDKATAAKFKQALEKAGAKIYIKLAVGNTAQDPVPSPATTATETPAQSTAQETNTAAIDWVILPPGSDVLRADERNVIAPVEVDISGIRLASVFEQTPSEAKPAPRAPDVSHLSTAPVGADILAGVKKDPAPPAPSVDHISVAEPGFDLSQLNEKIPVPPAPDTSFLSTAPVGADILEGVKKEPVPPAPDTSKIQLL